MKRLWLRSAILAPVLTLTLGPSASPAAPPSKAPSKAFAKVAKVEASFEPATAKRGQTVTWRLTAELEDGWHTYPANKLPNDSSDQNYTEIKPPTGGDLVFVGELKDPPMKTKVEVGLGPVRQSEGRKVVWERPVVVRPQAATGKQVVKVPVRLMVCDANRCLPPERLTVEAALTVSADAAVPVEEKYRDALQAGSGGQPAPPKPIPPQAAAPAVPADPEEVPVSEDYRQELAGIKDRIDVEPVRTDSGGLLGFLLAGVFWGFVSLITPCVFPMIPITVSFFLKQSEKEHHRPLTMALVYCATIVVVLTISAVALLSFFRQLSVNPWMNFAIGSLFVFFALSLFGMYEIELPAGLAQFTSSHEGKGGLVGTMFMALTFTIISFACVAPFLGGFGGTATTARYSTLELVLGGLAFSVTFAAPFFVLALFPSLLKKMPKSGSWLNSVKVVMGFLELAAALKFLRAGELALRPKAELFTYDFVMGIWIALAFLCGLYLLNVYRLPHDTPAEHLSVPRLLFSMLFLSLGLYLLPALFKSPTSGENQRPGGSIYAWIDSFLLPEPVEGTVKGGLAWSGDLKKALAEAEAQRLRTGERKLVLIDFTGKLCTNCKLNEQNVFTKPEIKELFKPYGLVQLYTDEVPVKFYPPGVRDRLGSDTARQNADAQANLWFQRETFGTEQLPLYVILEPLPNNRIAVVGSYAEGKINDEGAFAQFLKQPLEGNGAGQQAQARTP